METNEIFSEKEKKSAAKKYLSDLKMIDEIKVLVEKNHGNVKKVEKIKHRLMVLWSDYGLAEEEVRFLKTHFNIDKKQWDVILEKYRKFPNIEDVLGFSK